MTLSCHRFASRNIQGEQFRTINSTLAPWIPELNASLLYGIQARGTRRPRDATAGVEIEEVDDDHAAASGRQQPIVEEPDGACLCATCCGMCEG